MLLAGLWSVRIVKNCDVRLETAALGLRPWAAFSRPWSQFFPIQTDHTTTTITLFTRTFTVPLYQ